MTHDNELLVKLALNSDRLLDAFTKAGVAVVGYNASNHWTGALVALISLKLAQGGNLAGGIAGTGVLSILGLTNVVKSLPLSTTPYTYVPPDNPMVYYNPPM